MGAASEGEVGVPGALEVDVLGFLEHVRVAVGAVDRRNHQVALPQSNASEFHRTCGPARLRGFEGGAGSGAQQLLDCTGNVVGMCHEKPVEGLAAVFSGGEQPEQEARDRGGGGLPSRDDETGGQERRLLQAGPPADGVPGDHGEQAAFLRAGFRVHHESAEASGHVGAHLQHRALVLGGAVGARGQEHVAPRPEQRQVVVR